MKRAMSVVLVVTMATAGCSFWQVHGPAAPDRAGDCTISYSVPHRDYAIGFVFMAPLVGLGLVALVDGLVSDKNHPFNGDPYKPFLLPFGISAAVGAPFVVGAGIGDGRVDDCRRASGLKTRDQERAEELATWQAVVDAHNMEVTRLVDACITGGPAGAIADVRSTGPDLEAYPCDPGAGAFGVRGTGTHTLKSTTCTVMDRCANIEGGDLYRNLVARIPDVALHNNSVRHHCAALDTTGDAGTFLTIADWRQVDTVIAAARAELAANDLGRGVVVRIAVEPDCDRGKLEATLPALPPKPEDDLFTP